MLCVCLFDYVFAVLSFHFFQLLAIRTNVFFIVTFTGYFHGYSCGICITYIEMFDHCIVTMFEFKKDTFCFFLLMFYTLGFSISVYSSSSLSSIYIETLPPLGL